MRTIELYKKDSGRFISSNQFEFTHVMLDKESYLIHENELKNVKSYIDNIRNEKDMLEKELENQIKKHEIELENQIKKYENELEKLKIEYEKKLSEEKILNKNLIRISKERANSSRNIKNKKSHTGYILTSVTECFFNKNENKKSQKFIYFLVKMQTPYNISFTRANIVKLIDDDFTEILGAKMGLTDRLKTNLFDCSIEELNYAWSKYKNFIFDLEYQINAIRGFWEIKFKTKSLIKRDNDFLVSDKSNHIKSIQVQNQTQI